LPEVIDARGRWILTHAICRHCGRPSWDHYPEGVVADRYRCAYCGRSQLEILDPFCGAGTATLDAGLRALEAGQV